jgi:SAM-dependent methyltransferase
MKAILRAILNSKQLNPSLEPSEIFPSLEDELGSCRQLLKGRVLNAGAGNRDLSACVDGELTNQDIPQGLHNSNIHISSPLHLIPREDGYFDVIFCNAVLEHVENPGVVVEEFSRVCRAGGLLYLAVPFLQPEHKDPTDFQRYTADGLAALVESHGFAVEKVEPLHNIYTTLSWIITTWLSQEQRPRNLILKWMLYPALRYLCRHSKEQVFAAASAYRLIARRKPSIQ